MPKAQKIDTADLEVGQAKPREFTDVGLSETEIDVVDSLNWKEKADALAFMEEPVTIRLQDTTAPNTYPIVEIWVNGRVQRLMRGETQTVKRKYVEGLVRARKTTFASEKFVDSEGADAMRYPSRTAPEYQFELIKDTDKGRTWLKQRMAQAF